MYDGGSTGQKGGSLMATAATEAGTRAGEGGCSSRGWAGDGSDIMTGCRQIRVTKYDIKRSRLTLGLFT